MLDMDLIQIIKLVLSIVAKKVRTVCGKVKIL